MTQARDDQTVAQWLEQLNAVASPFDLIALLFFIASWVGYSLYADILHIRHDSLMDRMHEYREAWAKQMLTREMRMVDIQIVQVLVQNVSFFASATILIVGGLVAVLGAGDKAQQVVEEIPFAAQSTRFLWDIKVVLLIVIFIYAFFKFTWSLRQFNYVAVVIGSTPVGMTEENLGYARRLAGITSRAGDHFNRAMRAYYFGMAALAWFIQPSLLIIASIWVLAIIFRREFRSQILGLLGACGEPIGIGIQENRQSDKS